MRVSPCWKAARRKIWGAEICIELDAQGIQKTHNIYRCKEEYRAGGEIGTHYLIGGGAFLVVVEMGLESVNERARVETRRRFHELRVAAVAIISGSTHSALTPSRPSAGAINQS